MTAGARQGVTRVQPVPDPGNLEDYVALLKAGTLVDLASRPLRLVDCRWCKALGTSGATCPQSIRCPNCGAKPGSDCRRPSEHTLSRSFGAGRHKARTDAAYALDDRRAADGDLTVPAPWPKPAAAPSPVVEEFEQPDLFAEVAHAS